MEFTPDWKYQPPKEADINLIAGDISQGHRFYSELNQMGYSAPTLVVAGNHEFYRHGINDLRPDTVGNTTLMELTSTVYGFGNEAVLFLGATLWSDFNLMDDTAKAMRVAQLTMSDYRMIYKNGGRSVITPTDTQKLHARAVAWLDKAMANDTYKRVVVVTHHAPSPRSISEGYQGSNLNPAFCSDLEWLMFKHKPVLWVHGHVHSSHDYMVGNTRVVCNPRGYPTNYLDTFENPNFNPNLVIEI